MAKESKEEKMEHEHKSEKKHPKGSEKKGGRHHSRGGKK